MAEARAYSPTLSRSTRARPARARRWARGDRIVSSPRRMRRGGGRRFVASSAYARAANARRDGGQPGTVNRVTQGGTGASPARCIERRLARLRFADVRQISAPGLGETAERAQ